MDLLPCPFCGDAGEDYREPSYTKVSHYIYCNGCGCQGPVRYTTDEAVAAWNRRAANAPTAPALLALDRELRIRNLIAEGGFNTAAANREIAQFG